MALPVADCELILGERFYGFGNWRAKFWFIGPEQGQDPSENHDIAPRCKAFLALERDGLCDCREFHERIGIRATLQWYQPITKGKIRVQNTWRRLMKILWFYGHDSSPSTSELLKYQCERLGGSCDETCLLELSGLPAHHGGVERDRKTFRESRIRNIVSAMKSKAPEFVVIYRDAKNWELWKNEIEAQDGDAIADQRWRLGTTRIAFTKMPHAQSNRDLMNLGRSLRTDKR